MTDCDCCDDCGCDDYWVDPWVEQGICPFPPEPGTLEWFVDFLEPKDTPTLNMVWGSGKPE